MTAIWQFVIERHAATVFYFMVIDIISDISVSLLSLSLLMIRHLLSLITLRWSFSPLAGLFLISHTGLRRFLML